MLIIDIIHSWRSQKNVQYNGCPRKTFIHPSCSSSFYFLFFNSRCVYYSRLVFIIKDNCKRNQPFCQYQTCGTPCIYVICILIKRVITNLYLVVQQLILAARRGDKEKVEQCLKRGANINYQYRVSFTNYRNISHFIYLHAYFENFIRCLFNYDTLF